MLLYCCVGSSLNLNLNRHQLFKNKDDAEFSEQMRWLPGETEMLIASGFSGHQRYAFQRHMFDQAIIQVGAVPLPVFKACRAMLTHTFALLTKVESELKALMEFQFDSTDGISELEHFFDVRVGLSISLLNV